MIKYDQQVRILIQAIVAYCQRQSTAVLSLSLNTTTKAFSLGSRCQFVSALGFTLAYSCSGLTHSQYHQQDERGTKQFRFSVFSFFVSETFPWHRKPAERGLQVTSIQFIVEG